MKGLDTWTFTRHGEAFNAGPLCRCGHSEEVHDLERDPSGPRVPCYDCDECEGFEARDPRDDLPDEPFEE